MKKLLFCAGILALAASCTEEFEAVSVQQEQAKGISFAEVENALAPTTKGEFEVNDLGNGKVEFTPFWTAEKDKIGVFATGVIKNPEAAKLPGDANDQTSATWSGGLETTNKVSYKATRSERYAYFTATNQSDLLDFAEGVDAEKPATFLAVYPNGVELNNDVTPNWTNGFSFQLKLPELVGEQDQSNTEGKGVYELNAKYAIAKGAPLSDRQEAVGESVKLRFNRVLGGMAFSTKNVDKYTSKDNNLFGKLKSVKMKMLGEATQDAEGNITVLYKEGDATHKAPSKLTNGEDAIVQIDVTVNGAEYESAISKKSKDEGNATDYKTETGVSEVKVKLNGENGLEWTDADRAYMVLAPVSHGKNTSEEWREALELTYTFEYIDFVKRYTTTADWPAGEFGDMRKLDIDEYPYLVTKNRGESNTRALIVNSGSFSDIFVEGSENGNIEWNDGDGENPAVAEFNTIIVNEGVTLTKSELDMLKKFTNLAEITLAENTEIPNGTFNVNTVNGRKGQPLVKIDFPKVITIGKKAFGEDGLAGEPNGITDNIQLATVLLPSYKFGDAEIARSFLNPATLVTLDMSAVEAMNVGFPSTGFTLDGFKMLETIYVQDGIDLGSNAFSGCKVLANVLKKNNEDGTTAAATVDLKGTSVFRDCDALVSINIGGTEIPANSFNGCNLLKHVLVGGVQVVPTSVGLGAFQNCVALEKMDLSKAVDKTVEGETIPAIGDDAFNGCKAFYGGVNAENKVIVQVGGQTIGEKAFAGCTSLVHIEFLAATSLGDGVLNIGKSGALKQIQLDKKVTFRSTQSANTFGEAELMKNVDLFITPGQAGVNGNTLTLSGSNTVTFKSIRDRAAD